MVKRRQTIRVMVPPLPCGSAEYEPQGNCWDNASAEVFSKPLKRELETLDGRHAQAEARQSAFMYIEAYYTGFVYIRLLTIMHQRV
jgi:hypothetical protein